MSNDYVLKFDLSAYRDLDNFALLADQKDNLGDKGDWFNQFRGGVYGFNARVLGVQIHYEAVHSWLLIASPRILYQMTEYHLSSILFNMDSAIECMVFALNALGYAANSAQFKDVTIENELRLISPKNILLKASHSSKEKEKKYVPGYDKYFPSLKKYWLENKNLIDKITEQHNVSKHRSSIFEGGRRRTDPPHGFFEMLGIEDEAQRIIVSPFAKITLISQPKTPWRKRQPQGCKNLDKLEDVAEKFCIFVNACGTKALDDAQNTIKLNRYEL